VPTCPFSATSRRTGHRELEGDQLKGPRYPGRASAGCSRFDWVTSARPDPQLAKQQPANGPSHANGEEFENASLLFRTPMKISTAIAVRNARTGLSTAAAIIDHMAQDGRLFMSVPPGDTDLGYLAPLQSTSVRPPHPETPVGSLLAGSRPD